MFFFRNEALAKTFRQRFPGSDQTVDVVAGGLAGLIYRGSLYPVDLIRARMMAHEESGRAKDILFQILRSDGICGLYRGASLLVARSCVCSAVAFPVFNSARRFFCL